MAAWEEAPEVEAAAWEGAPEVEEAIAREAISRLESGLRGGLQGASMGWSDEAAAIADAAAPGLSRGVNPDVLAAAPAGADFAMRRAAAQEFYRQRNKQAAQDNPGTYLAGEVAGGLGTAAAMPGGAARGAGLLERALSSAITGAASGVTSAVGHNEGGSGTQQALDALTGLGSGALLGAASTGIGPALSAASRGLRRAAVSQGRKALTGVGNPLSAKAPLPDASVEAALDAGAVWPLGTATGAARRLDVATGKAGDAYEAMLNELEAAGVEGPVISKVAERLRSVARDVEENAADTRIPSFYRRHAAAIAKKEAPASINTAAGRVTLSMADEGGFPVVRATGPNGETVGIAEFVTQDVAPDAIKAGHVKVADDFQRQGLASAMYRLAEKSTGRRIIPSEVQSESGKAFSEAYRARGPQRLGLEQSRQIRARLQREAPYGAAPGSLSESGAAKQDVARVLNDLIDEAVTEQARLAPDQAARFEPIRRQLANLIKARDVAQAAANKEAKRKSIGLLPVIAGVGGATTGNPLVAISAALGMGLVDRRGASTLAALARRGSQATGAAAGMRPGTAAAAAGQLEPEVMALIRALRENNTEAP